MSLNQLYNDDYPINFTDICKAPEWQNFQVNSLKVCDFHADNYNIEPTDITPGPPNTFLHTTPGSSVTWTSISGDGNIYENNGQITDSTRIVDCNNNNLEFTNISSMKIGVQGNDDCTIENSANNFAGLGFGGAGFYCNDGSNIAYSTVSDAGGLLSCVMLLDNGSGGNTNATIIDGRVNLTADDGVNPDTQLYLYSNVNSRMELSSPKIILAQIPPTDNALTSIMVRNPIDGELKIRDVSTITSINSEFRRSGVITDMTTFGEIVPWNIVRFTNLSLSYSAGVFTLPDGVWKVNVVLNVENRIGGVSGQDVEYRVREISPGSTTFCRARVNLGLDEEATLPLMCVINEGHQIDFIVEIQSITVGNTIRVGDLSAIDIVQL